LGISEAVYGYTPVSKPPEDGKLRRLKPAYNWLRFRDQILHPRDMFQHLRPISYNWVYTPQ
jgi:hypothetical protein